MMAKLSEAADLELGLRMKMLSVRRLIAILLWSHTSVIPALRSLHLNKMKRMLPAVHRAVTCGSQPPQGTSPRDWLILKD